MRCISRFALLAIVGLSSCWGIGMSMEDHLAGPWYLVEIDGLKSGMGIAVKSEAGGYSGVLPGEHPFGVGSDARHVLAKCHPERTRARGGEMDRSITHYFVLVVSDGTIHGPLDEAGFQAARSTLGVAPGLDFSRTFKELE